jgi:hypothetical protein
MLTGREVRMGRRLVRRDEILNDGRIQRWEDTYENDQLVASRKWGAPQGQTPPAALPLLSERERDRRYRTGWGWSFIVVGLIFAGVGLLVWSSSGSQPSQSDIDLYGAVAKARNLAYLYAGVGAGSELVLIGTILLALRTAPDPPVSAVTSQVPTSTAAPPDQPTGDQNEAAA